MTKRIAIIPARGGSKRIKNKNIINFCGQPLISYSLEAARKSELFDEIHVSTEDLEIKTVVEKLGFKIPFLRDVKLADDFTPIMPVLKWVLEQYQAQGRRFDEVFLLMPTAPLMMAEDLRESYRIFEANGRVNPLLAVAAYPVPVEWAFTREATGRLHPCSPGKFAIRSQDLGVKYFDTGSFAIFAAKDVLSPAGASDENYISYVMPKDRVVDIDDPEDLSLAEALFYAHQQKGKRTP